MLDKETHQNTCGTGLTGLLNLKLFVFNVHDRKDSITAQRERVSYVLALNEIAPPPVGSGLNACPMIGGTVWEGLGGVTLLEKVCPWGWALRLKGPRHSQSGCSHSLTGLCPHLIPALWHTR